MTERGGRPGVPDYGLDAPKVVRNLLVLGGPVVHSAVLENNGSISVTARPR